MNDPSENMTSYCKTTLHISLGEGNDMSWTCKEMTGVTRQHDTKQTRKRSRRIGSTCEGYWWDLIMTLQGHHKSQRAEGAERLLKVKWRHTVGDSQNKGIQAGFLPMIYNKQTISVDQTFFFSFSGVPNLSHHPSLFFPEILALITFKGRETGQQLNHPITPPKFNIAPENRPSQNRPSQRESNLPTIIFQGLC